MFGIRAYFLATSVLSLGAVTELHALPVEYPPAVIDGNGASSTAHVLNRVQQCLGQDTPIGLPYLGSSYTVPPHLYQSTTGKIFDCGTGAFPTRTVQPNLTFRYVATGSAGGRTSWSGFSTSAITSVFTYGPNIHYALSGSPISSANLTAYNTNARGTLGDHDSNPATPNTYNKAGNPIQIPLYVVPIALAYDPLYGKRLVGGVVKELTFNVNSAFVQTDGAGLPTGGLRMRKQTYCYIMNGVITNWNDVALKADNGGQSLMDPDDDLTRWNAVGVPIVLIGRNDDSGSTSVFNRHLNAVDECNGGPFDNGIGGHANTLPAAARSTARYDKFTGAMTSGAEFPGKFGLVDGSFGVVRTVGRDPADPPPEDGYTTLNGRLGYLSADYVRPANVGSSLPVLHAAALQQGNTTAFKMPTAANAIPTFVGYNPPQSNLNGTYNSTAPGDRTNPVDWVLRGNATTGVANPTKGYPIVGTTNLLLYTCYRDPSVRLGIFAMAALHFGKLTADSSGDSLPSDLVRNMSKGVDLFPLGVSPRNGVASLPTPWQTAIWETFFQKVTKAAPNSPASLNLWIQDRLPTSQALIDGDPANGEVLANPTCTSGQGA